MILEAKNAVFGYGERRIIRVDALAMRAGRCTGIVGPNGSGKSTLVRGLPGLLTPLEGEVLRRTAGTESGVDIEYGYVPQHRAAESHWPMTAFDAATLVVSSRRRMGWVGRESAKVREAMGRLGIEHLAPRPFANLSGGQQQRVRLAGALALEPDILVLDEPTDGLDVRSRQDLLGTVREMTDKGLCIMMVSHDVEDLAVVSDEVAWIHAGEGPDQPSNVEVVTTAELAERVAAGPEQPTRAPRAAAAASVPPSPTSTA